MSINIKSSSSTVVLVLSNCVPLIGVLFFNWNLINIITIYWIESGVIGFYTFLKILFLQEQSGPASSFSLSVSRKRNAFLFITRYSFVLLVYGIFLVSFLLIINSKGSQHLTAVGVLSTILPAIISLFLSHGYSFLYDFFYKEGRFKQNIKQLLWQPYSRAAILHGAVLFGSFISIFLGNPLGMLIVIVIIKTCLDIGVHVKEKEQTTPSIIGTVSPDLIPQKRGAITYTKAEGDTIHSLLRLLLIPALIGFVVIGFAFSTYGRKINSFKILETKPKEYSSPSLNTPKPTPSSTPKPLSPLWIPYHNNEMGYGYQYPNTWINEENSYAQSWNEFKNNESFINVSLVQKDETGSVSMNVNINKDGGTCQIIKSFNWQGPDKRSYQTKIDGISAVVFEAELSFDSDTSFYEKRVYVPLGEHCYNIVFHDYKGNPDKDIFDRIESSISLD